MSKHFVIYQKMCIICSHNFDSFKVNALYCGKKCRNRARYLPQRLINSLIEKYSSFTTVKRFGDSVISSQEVIKGELFNNAELKEAELSARALAKERGIKLPTVVEDNLKFINKIDPIGDADGFGVSDTDIQAQEETQNDNNTGNNVDTGDSNNIVSSSVQGHTDGFLPIGVQRKGLRKLGGVK